MPIRLFALLVVILTTAGCAARDSSVAAQSRLPVQMPTSWQAGNQKDIIKDGRLMPWLDEFSDPTLKGLVTEAVAINFDLRATASRMEAARAQARIAGADRLPELQLAGSAERTERSGDNPSGAPTSSKSYQLQGQLSWEADLWGRLSDSSHAAQADWRAAAADYQAARLSLAANIARRWFDVIESRAQTQLARDTVDSFEKSLQTIELQYRQGIGEALDVRLARNNLATAQATLAQQRRQQRNLVRELETLLGRYPAGAMKQLPDVLPEPSNDVPAGLPAELLMRRPDLLAADARLEAAGYRVAGANKNRLPNFTLTATGGTTSDTFRDLLNPELFVWTLAGNLVQPLFQGGRLEAEREVAKARNSEALHDYAQTALDAFREVEDALDSETHLTEQVQASRTAAEEARAAEALALDQYRRGLTDIITLLESQRRRFDADRALLEVRNLRLQNRINLHLALGGDFAASPTTASTEAQ